MKTLDLNIAPDLQREPVSHNEVINLADNSKIDSLLLNTIDNLNNISIENQIVFFKAITAVVRQNINSEIDMNKSKIETIQKRNLFLFHAIL